MGIQFARIKTVGDTLTLLRTPTAVAARKETTLQELRALIERIRRVNPRWEKGISYRFGVLSGSGRTRYAVTGQTDQGFTVLLYDGEWQDYQVRGIVHRTCCNVECSRTPQRGDPATYSPDRESFELLYRFVEECDSAPDAAERAEAAARRIRARSRFSEI